jgi:outer membrane protein
MTRNLPLLLPALLLLAPTGARAETLTLDQCVAAALKDNPDLGSAASEIDVATAQKEAAAGGYSPKLRLEAGAQRWNNEMSAPLFSGFSFYCPTCNWELDPDPSLQGKTNPATGKPYYLIDKATVLRPKYTWSLSATVVQPLGALWTIREANVLTSLGIDVARIKQRQAKRDLAYQVSEAYYRILQAKRMAEVAQKSVEQIEAQVRKADTFFARGVVAKNDVLRANLGLAAAKQRLIQMNGNVTLARGRLATLLGRSPDSDLDVATVEPPTHETNRVIVTQAEDEAVANRFELKEIDARIRQAEANVRLAKSKMLPQVNAIANYSRSPGSVLQSKESWFIGATASWDVWEGGSTYRGIGEAKAKMQQALAARRKAADLIRLDARAAHVNLTTAAESLDVAASAVTQAEENFRMEQKRYENASNTSFDVLDAETQLTSARGQHQAALYDFLIARSNLARAMGTPHPALKDAP